MEKPSGEKSTENSVPFRLWSFLPICARREEGYLISYWGLQDYEKNYDLKKQKPKTTTSLPFTSI